MSNEIVLILDNIRSAQNVGSIFRTADAIGVSKIYITGYTPAPIDRFGRERNDINKAALGAQKSISWEQGSILDVIKFLRDKEFQIISLEQDADSLDYKKVELKDKVAIVLGNEVDGIDKNVLDISDCILEIPMMGKKESLNVSVAAGILLFRLFDK